MLSHEFIFSEKRSMRMIRHILFWVVTLLYYKCINLLLLQDQLTSQPVSYSTLLSILLLLPQILLVYPLLYFVLPLFILKGQYLIAICLTYMLVVFNAIVEQIMMPHMITLFYFLAPERYKTFETYQFFEYYRNRVAVIEVMTGGITCAVMAVSIKLIKHWYLKEQRNLQLQKENTEAQLQLLTAQVQPHFLFNTLNNIYSKAQTESPDSAKMIMRLSHIFRFVFEEGKQALAPLESELQMLTDYINLEKMRYDERLDLHISMPAKTENFYIAPLLILPFVENCFKHGTSKMLQKPWINLKIEIKDNLLFMKLMNGKKSAVQHNRKGTGIENVRKRLDLLYKNKHTLQISEDVEVFVVNLTMELVKIEQPPSVHLYHSATAYVQQ